MHPQDSYAKAAILEHTCVIMVDVMVVEADAASVLYEAAKPQALSGRRAVSRLSPHEV